MNEYAAATAPLQQDVYPPLNKDDEQPPAYENPRIDFSGGWKDRGFAIAFWIHFIIVTLIGCILGIPTVVSFAKAQSLKGLGRLPSNFDVTPVVCGFAASIGVAATASFMAFFILQCCSGKLIRCSYFIIISLETLLVLLIFILVPWPISIAVGFFPVLFLLFTLIYIACVRKRVAFAEAHLKTGLAALNSHRSLVLFALLMILVEILWFALWLLMVIGLQGLVPDSTSPPSSQNNEQTTTSAMFIDRSTQSTYNRMDPSFVHYLNMTSFLKKNHSSNGYTAESVGKAIIEIALLFSWYWGTVTFANIIHFIAACAVGDWWFKGGANEQYRMGTSIKRAFTTNFGTIALGSFFEAIIKAVRSYAEERSRKSIFACIVSCLLGILEKVVGYMNEWGFIYAALSGQTFVQSSRSFIDLFKNRGWTMVLNDALIGVTLGIINFIIGLLSAFVGGFLIYLLMPYSEIQIFTIVTVSIIGFLLGIFMSSIITTVLTSCVRTVFVCFALNPAALGASHPDHLEDLSRVWHKLYPKEFAASGYSKYYTSPTV